MKKTILGNTISRVITSSIMGHSGSGMFPLTLFPPYQRLMRVIKQAEIYNLTKSSTAEKNTGNFILGNPFTWKYIQQIGENGLLNAYGLTNHGVRINSKGAAFACSYGFKVIPNFYPQFAKGREIAAKQNKPIEAGLDITIKATVQAIKRYSRIMEHYFWAVELNYSCPNSKEKIRENIADALACTKAVRKAFPNLIIIAKISYVHPIEFVQELVRFGADVIHAINTIPYDMVYKNGAPSPLADVGGGGVSGKPISRMAFEYNCLLRKKTHADIIMGGGITCLDDANRYFNEAGADIISICTMARLNPKEAEKIIEFYA
jgi:dihydroorotate dehydrogenase